MEEKRVLAAASHEKQKYFFEPQFEGIPQEIQEDIKAICVIGAEKLACTFLIGFEADGTVYFQTIAQENDFSFDDIGAELEIKELCRKHKDLLEALKLWYVVFQSEKGKLI